MKSLGLKWQPALVVADLLQIVPKIFSTLRVKIIIAHPSHLTTSLNKTSFKAIFMTGNSSGAVYLDPESGKIPAIFNFFFSVLCSIQRFQLGWFRQGSTEVNHLQATSLSNSDVLLYPIEFDFISA